MPNLSVVIITNNEAANIGRAIDSVKPLTDDIVVVDDYSTDDTEKICREKGVRFEQHPWEGYGKNKNHGNSLAQHDWILSIDADEAVTPELATSIQAALQDPKAVAYDLPFITNYCGQWIKHGRWYPESHIRLFDKRHVHWNTDDVHEGLVLPPGATAPKLKGFVHHYSITSLQHHLGKVNKYSTLAAEKMHHQGRTATFLKLYIAPYWKFWIDYLFRLGFLDGFHGLCIAVITSFEAYLKYAKLKELVRGARSVER